MDRPFHRRHPRDRPREAGPEAAPAVREPARREGAGRAAIAEQRGRAVPRTAAHRGRAGPHRVFRTRREPERRGRQLPGRPPATGRRHAARRQHPDPPGRQRHGRGHAPDARPAGAAAPGRQAVRRRALRRHRHGEGPPDAGHPRLEPGRPRHRTAGAAEQAGGRRAAAALRPHGAADGAGRRRPRRHPRGAGQSRRREIRARAPAARPVDRQAGRHRRQRAGARARQRHDDQREHEGAERRPLAGGRHRHRRAGRGGAGCGRGGRERRRHGPVRRAGHGCRPRGRTGRRRAGAARRRRRRHAPEQYVAGQHRFAPGGRLRHVGRIRPGSRQGDGAPRVARDPGIVRERSEGPARIEQGRQREHPRPRHRGRPLRAVQQAVRPPGTRRQQCAGAGRARMAHRKAGADESGRPAEGERPLAHARRQEQYGVELHARHQRRRQVARPSRLPRDAAPRQGLAVRRHFVGRAAVLARHPEPVGPDPDERRGRPVPQAGPGCRETAGRTEPADAAAHAEARLPRRVLGRPCLRRHHGERDDHARRGAHGQPQDARRRGDGADGWHGRHRQRIDEPARRRDPRIQPRHQLARVRPRGEPRDRPRQLPGPAVPARARDEGAHLPHAGDGPVEVAAHREAGEFARRDRRRRERGRAGPQQGQERKQMKTIVAAVQMVSTPVVEENIATARRLIADAAARGAQLVTLPEYWPIMGMTDTDKVAHAEQPGAGPIQDFLAGQARAHGIWIIGGTLPLVSHDAGRVLNTTLVYDPAGQHVGRYDKIHLFGFNKGSESYDEARTIVPGETVGSFDAPFGKVGLAICYDLRFPELFRAMGDCALIVVPAAFTHTTGLAHWEVLLRARAIENQCYVLASAQGGLHKNDRRTFGHSMLIDPWGEVKDVLPEGEGVVSGEIDPDFIAKTRCNDSIRTESLLPRCRARRPVDAIRAGRRQADHDAGDHVHAQGRLCRPVFPVYQERRLEPGRRHRQERQLFDRPGCRRACRVGRQDRVFVLGRDFAGRPAGRRRRHAHDRARGCRPREGRLKHPAVRRPRAVPAARPARLARRHRESRAAGAHRKDRPRQGSARRAGDGRPRGRVRRRARRAQRRRAGGRHPSARARVRHRHRRAERPARNGLVGRRRPLRLFVLQRRAAGKIRERSRAGGPREPGSPAGPGRPDDHRARPGLARRAAARSRRPWPRRRLQPQGLVRVCRHDRPARRREGRDRRRRRHAAGPPRFAEHGRRGQPDPVHDPHRGRHPEGLHPGHDECAPDEDARDGQRAPRIVCAPADAAHDEHVHAGRRQGPGRDPRVRQERPVRGELRRRPGRHHERQVRVLGQRSLHDRRRQGDVPGEGRDPDRQRSGHDEPHLDDRQRHAPGFGRGRVRQGRPERAGGRRPADPAHRRRDRRRYGLSRPRRWRMPPPT
ncbi:hypothetical protein Lal_00014836 [Lupinus albus]|nr:hypothetical protein Lal_00014836 [Lupinus albus]